MYIARGLSLRKPKEKPSQKYPDSKVSVGATLHRVLSWVDDSGRAKVEMQEWVVRSIKRKSGSQSQNGVKNRYSDASYNNVKYVHLTQKIKGCTWGKLSTKQFDYGWLSSISRYYKIKFQKGEPLPFGVYTTKLAAYQYAVSDAEADVYWYFDQLKNKTMSDDCRLEYQEEESEAVLILKACTTQLKRFKTKSKR
jgi:hypothetical protein